MEEQKKETARPAKMSYEQLENVAHQLSEQNKQLYAKLQEINMANVFKRLDYLFKVLEYNHMFDEEFVTKCSSEVVEIMTIPKSENTEAEKAEETANTKK